MSTRNAAPAKAGAAMVSSDLAVKTAWLYYVEGLTQEQIADRLKVTRVNVMRSLAACTADGVVVTTINAQTTRQVELERALERQWGLDAAIVVPTPSGEEHLERSIGHAIALYLDEQMQDGMTLAIGGGATLHSSIGFLSRRHLKGASVVALVGSLPHSQWINPSTVAAKVAEAFDVDSYQITAPVIAHSRELRDLLWAQPELVDVRKRAAKADIALLTVGEMSANATIFRHGIVPQSFVAPLKARGAVANMLCYFIDAEGRMVEHEVNDRVMAVDLEAVGAMPNLVLAAGGKRKIPAIRAALAAVKANVLITDSDSAAALTKLP